MKYFSLFALLILSHLTSLAFSCTPLPVEEEIKNSTYIFTGKVIEKNPTEIMNQLILFNYRNHVSNKSSDIKTRFSDYKKMKYFSLNIYSIEICQNYIGDAKHDTIHINTNKMELEFRDNFLDENDKEFLFYCFESTLKFSSPILTFNICSRTVSIDYAENDIAYLEKLLSPKSIN